MALPTNDPGPLGPRPAERLADDRREPPTRRLAQQELSEVVRRAVENLNERQRIAVLLNKFEEMSYADIAKVMGLSTKAVKSLLSRARTNLRAALGQIYSWTAVRLNHLRTDAGPIFINRGMQSWQTECRSTIGNEKLSRSGWRGR